MGVSKEDFKALEHRVTVLLGSTENRFNSVQHALSGMATGVAQNLAAVKANLDSKDDALEQFDIFNRIWAKMFLRIIERQEQTAFLHANHKTEMDLTEIDRTEIKTKAKEWFDLSFETLKNGILEEREAYIKELRAKAAEIQAEQERQAAEAEQAKKEGEVAEAALRGAEQDLSSPGGYGSEIPAGVQTFGG